MNIRISEKKIFLYQSIIIIILLLFSLFGQYSKYFLGRPGLLGFVDLFDLEQESNIPTYFQVLFIAFSSIILLFIIINEKIKKNPKHFWVVLLLLSLYLGTDEAAQIHERWGYVLSKIIKYEFKGIFTFSWTIIGSLLALLLIIYFSFFISRINRKVRKLFILSAFIYLSGAIIIESLGGYFFDKFSLTFFYKILANLEETLEMFGIIIFIKGLLCFIKTEIKSEEISMKIEIT
jgi:hypothetical protein